MESQVEEVDPCRVPFHCRVICFPLICDTCQLLNQFPNLGQNLGKKSKIGFPKEQITFFLTFYFILEYSQLTMWWFQVDSKGTQHTYTCIHSLPNSPPI